jgi:hypothetical protein
MIYFRSVCYLEWTEGKGTEYSGTGFLMKASSGGPFMFASAGHNFRDGKNKLAKTELKRFNMMFNNPKGLSYKDLIRDTRRNTTIHLNLQTDLLDKFDFELGICDEDEMFTMQKKNGKTLTNTKVAGRPHADFMVLTLHDTEAVKNFLQDRDLAWLNCAAKEHRKSKQNESVLTFGYPAIEEDGNYPLRLSFGNEGSPEAVERLGYPMNLKEENIVYDLDTEVGSSGSPVIGRNEHSYTVKAVHVSKASKLSWNIGQKFN